MGVYIKGMDKPSECDLCQFENYGYCLTLGSYIEAEHGIDSRCPLIEVKAPHGRLIDADVLCERLMTEWDNADELGRKIISGIMADVVTPIVVGTPTVIEAEVE